MKNFSFESNFKGSMIGPPLAGLLCDLSGSYDLTFYAAGFLFFIATLLSCAASPGCAPKTWQKSKMDFFKNVRQSTLMCAKVFGKGYETWS